MSGAMPGPDLVGIVHETEVEIVAAEVLRSAATDGVEALGTAELGYYEAELVNLHDAATGAGTA